MNNKSRIGSIAVCVIAAALTILFVFLILRGDRADPAQADAPDIQAEVLDTERPTVGNTEEEPGLGSHPDIKTDIGSNEKGVTPGGVEYSFVDTTGMSPKEIEELEARLDEEAGYTYEPNTNIGSTDATAGMYRNAILSCTFPSGSVLKIGTDKGDGNAIYLNPVYDAVEEEYFFTEEETAFAFYLKTMYGEDVSTSGTVQLKYNEGSNAGHKFFYIKDRTFDTLVPAEYEDSVNYGVKWIDLNNYHGFDGSDYDMEIRIVRLPDAQLMGTAKLHIAFDPNTGSYSIVSLINSDVSSTGELTAEERDDVLEKAFAFFCSDEKGQSTFVDQSDWEIYKDKAVVEKVDWLYFPRLFDAKGNVASAGKFSGINAYAVNINYPGYGFVTIYCASRQQINGMRATSPDNEDLQPFAFDAFKPFDKTTLFIPLYQQQEFFK